MNGGIGGFGKKRWHNGTVCFQPRYVRIARLTYTKKWQKVMRQKRVVEIVLPYQEDMPLVPSVTLNDKIIHAVELMVDHDLSRIAVVRNRRAVGMVRLEDAFNKLGIRMPSANGRSPATPTSRK